MQLKQIKPKKENTNMLVLIDDPDVRASCIHKRDTKLFKIQT